MAGAANEASRQSTSADATKVKQSSRKQDAKMSSKDAKVDKIADARRRMVPTERMLVAIKVVQPGRHVPVTKLAMDERVKLKDVIAAWVTSVMKAETLPVESKVLGATGPLDLTRSLAFNRRYLQVKDGRPTITVTWPADKVQITTFVNGKEVESQAIREQRRLKKEEKGRLQEAAEKEKHWAVLRKAKQEAIARKQHELSMTSSQKRKAQKLLQMDKKLEAADDKKTLRLEASTLKKLAKSEAKRLKSEQTEETKKAREEARLQRREERQAKAKDGAKDGAKTKGEGGDDGDAASTGISSDDSSSDDDEGLAIGRYMDTSDEEEEEDKPLAASEAKPEPVAAAS